jgi:hypothetical protein
MSATTDAPPILANTATSTCKAKECQAALHWRRSTVTGKNICLDAQPVTSDARFVSKRSFHYVVTSSTECRPVSLEEWIDHDTPVYISHWRTCTDPSRFNKGT